MLPRSWLFRYVAATMIDAAFASGEELLRGEIGYADSLFVADIKEPHRRLRLPLSHSSDWVSPGGLIVGGLSRHQAGLDTCFGMTSIRGGWQKSYCTRIGELYRFAFTNDGRKLAVVLRRVGDLRGPWRLAVFDCETDKVNEIKVLTGANGPTAGPSWSIDGKRLALSWGHNTMVFSGADQILSLPGSNAQLSPGGTRIAFQPNPGIIAVADAASGAVEQTMLSSLDCLPRWSEDERSLLITEGGPPPDTPRIIVKVIDLTTKAAVASWRAYGPGHGSEYILTVRPWMRRADP